MPRIPLIEDLTSEPVPPGSQLLVEFDSTSQWYNALFTLAMGWMKTGGRVDYYCFAQAPDSIRSRLTRLGLELEELERKEQLAIWDWYSCTLGQKSKEKHAADSLKVAELSLHVLKVRMQGLESPDLLAIGEDISVLDRFNEERVWVEYQLNRSIPAFRMRKITCIRGLVRGLHSDFVYKRLETANDGIIEFRLDDTGEETRNLLRIKMMRDVSFDSKWHRVNFDARFAATLDKTEKTITSLSPER